MEKEFQVFVTNPPQKNIIFSLCLKSPQQSSIHTHAVYLGIDTQHEL